MSYIQIDSLEEPALIAQYIIEYRGRGHVLSYEEHRLICEWLKLAGGADLLLLVLSDIIPKFYQDLNRRQQPPLQRMHGKIQKILQAKIQHDLQLAPPSSR